MGYEFRNGKGSEGIHPVNGRSIIDDCTKMYNINNNNDPKKASTYINNAFKGKYFSEIDETLKENVFYTKLEEMLKFSRFEFDLSVSLNVKKKIKIETKWQEKRFDEVADIIRGVTYSKADQTIEETENIVLTADNITLNGDFEINKKVYLFDGFNVPENKKLKKNDIFMCFSSGSKDHLGKVAFIENDTNYLAGGFMGIIRAKDVVQPKYVYQLLNSLLRQSIRDIGSGSNINNLSGLINEVKIPVPPKEIQEKIVKEIEVLEEQEKTKKYEISNNKAIINQLFESILSKSNKTIKLNDDSIFEISIGKRVLKNEFVKDGKIPVYSANVFTPFGYIEKLLITNFEKPSVIWGIDGDWMVNYIPENYPFYPTDHCGVLKVKNNIINEKYLAFVLKIEGNIFGFSRTKRASIDRIKNIKISFPPIFEQKIIIRKIEEIEKQIETLEQELSEIPNKKVEVLQKHLN